MRLKVNTVATGKRTRAADELPPGSSAEQRDGREVNYGHLPALVGYQVNKAHARLFQMFTDALRGLGLAPRQYSALLLIGLNPGLSQIALADALGADRTTMVPITTRFAKAGWVGRTRRSDDRRVYSLMLTPQGEAVLAKARQLIEVHEKQFVAALGENAREMARTLLSKIADIETRAAALEAPSKARTSGRSRRADSSFAMSPFDIDYGHLRGQVGYQLRRAHSYLFRTFLGSFRQLQLAPGQYSTLVLISLNPGLSQIDLAAATALDGSTIVPITDKFVKLGWVRRTRLKNDRRVYSLRITPAGQTILDEARPLISAREKRLATVLKAHERDVLIDILTRLGPEEEPHPHRVATRT